MSTRSGLAPKIRLAAQIYLRPASWASITACSRLEVSRTEASLISIGRLTAAMTSILEPFIIEIARLEGVPPNISVSTTTPGPLSTLVTAETISWRRCSILSSGPTAIVSICFCGPTTCSNAARNSAARRPWVTRTIPIIERTCSLGHFVLERTPKPVTLALRAPGNADFARIETYLSHGFSANSCRSNTSRRCDCRCGRAVFLRLEKNDFVPNTIIGPACSERPLRLGPRPAEQFYKNNQKVTTNGMGQL